MNTFFIILMALAALAALGSLFVGVGVMAKGGETSKKYSNKLMQARVALQALAVLMFVLAMLAAGK